MWRKTDLGPGEKETCEQHPVMSRRI